MGEEGELEKYIFGRFKSHLKMGIVGLPNIGKSSLFNLLTKQHVPCENRPFCTKEPNFARVAVPDPRFDFLCQKYTPQSEVPGYLEIHDIAGLVSGASEGLGLGNAFLSHINGVDGIYHMIRIFDNQEISHVEGMVDPVRDMEIIHQELRLKDIESLNNALVPVRRISKADPEKRQELEALEKAYEWLNTGHDIKNGTWTYKEYSYINDLLLLTSKPVIYIVNMSTEDYLRQKNKWLPKIKAWIDEHNPGSVMLPISVSLEQQIEAFTDETERQNFLTEHKTRSMIPKIISTGFKNLHLIVFFTVGEDEVRAWVIREGTTAPGAAGCIHSDFEEKFIRAEVMKYDDFKELGSEQEVRNHGKYYTKGKDYIVEDGDILLIKHGAGGKKRR